MGTQYVYFKRISVFIISIAAKMCVLIIHL